jgi:hypothetical protein
MIQGQSQAKSGRSYQKKKKNLKAKRAGGVTQVVQCLPSKCKALSSNPKTTKKRKIKDLFFLSFLMVLEFEPRASPLAK